MQFFCFLKLYVRKGIRLLAKPFLPICSLLFKYISPSVVVMIDGGICSQMGQYLLSKVFVDKGYKVEYDLSFFKYGKDMNGDHVRNFDLQRAFPYIPIKRVSQFKRFVYIKYFAHYGSFPTDDSAVWTQLKPPVILLGYYGGTEKLFDQMRKVFAVDPSVLDAENLDIYNKIPDNSVAVHVRRGDLANVKDGNYGPPVSETYFLDSITYLNNRLHSPVFYFFSDEMDYVRDAIIPKLSNNVKYQLVTNGSDKGYYDLLLISRCSHQITSKGTLGKFGACLNPNSGIVIISKDEKQYGPLLYTNKEIIKM